MEERLQKYMARCGVASRRKCEEYILEGNVSVNGIQIFELGAKVDAEKDKVMFNGKIIEPEQKKVYIALHKPVGYVTTVKDEKNRPTVIDLIQVEERIFPIGRLDYNTSGLLLLTNDGDVYNKIIHPRKSIGKTYVAVVRGNVDDWAVNKLRSGVDIGGYITSEAQVEILKRQKDKTEFKITIHEGKNRQIRKMCAAVGHPVIKLHRISVGGIKLGNLQYGKWRHLEKAEIQYLKDL